MPLSNDLVSQFAKLVTDKKRTDQGKVMYGKIVATEDGQKYVRLDGSTENTPITETKDDVVNTSSSADLKDGDRVSVLVQNHTVTVTGNMSSPAARTEDVIVMAKNIQANKAYIDNLSVNKANISDLQAAEAEIRNLKTYKADIEDLDAANAEIRDLKATQLTVDIADARYASIYNLTAINADIARLETADAEIKNLVADKVSVEEFNAINAEIESLGTKYAEIDFSNIKMAAVEELFAKSGIIKDLVVGDTSITGELVGVTLKGDLIEAGTLKADKLVVKGSDGIFYKLNVEAGGVSAEEAPMNSLHGSVITAKSITAEKVNVKDLVAFGATIGGFKLTDNSIFSGVKSSADNTTKGVYLDNEGQVSFGDASRYIKFYRIGDLDVSVTYDVESETGHLNVSDINKFIERAQQEGVTFSNGVPVQFTLFGDTDGSCSIAGPGFSAGIYTFDGTEYQDYRDEWGVYFAASEMDATGIFTVTYTDNTIYKLVVAADEIFMGASGKSVETIVGEVKAVAEKAQSDTDDLKSSTEEALSELEPIGKVSGNPIRIDDVAELSHEMKISLITKNIFGGKKLADAMAETFSAAVDATAKTVTYIVSNIHDKMLTDEFESNTQYTIILHGKNLSNLTYTNIAIYYTDGTRVIPEFETAGSDSYAVITTDAAKSVSAIKGYWHSGTVVLNYEKCGIFEGAVSVDEYEPYVDFSEMVPKKNVIKYPYSYTTRTINGVTFTDNGDGGITVNGTATANTVFSLQPVSGNYTGTYIISGGISDNLRVAAEAYSEVGGSWLWSASDIGNGKTISCDGVSLTIYIYVITGSTINNAIVYPQLEPGTVATEYELYQLVPAVNVTVYGKNLLPYPYYDTTKTVNGVTFIDNSDGSITVNGTNSGTSNALFYFVHKNSNLTLNKGDYALSGCGGAGSTSTYGIGLELSDIDTYDYIKGYTDYGSGSKINAPRKVQFISYIAIKPGATIDNVTFYPQLELGTEVTENEPNIYIPEDAKNNLIPYPYYFSNNRTINGVEFVVNEDRSVTVNGTATANTYFYLQMNYDYGSTFNSANTYGATNGEYTISKRMLYSKGDKSLSIYIPNGTTVDELLYPTIKRVVKASECKPLICYVNEDGSVSGVKSVYPVTTLMCNNQYAIIDCEYNRDNTLGNDRVHQSNLEDRIVRTETSIANLTVGTDGINAEVQKLTEIQNNSASALDERLKVVEEKASVAVTEEAVNIAIESALTEKGASKIETKTGYRFDDDGMMVHKSNSEMKTKISDDGMTVYKNDDAMLTANNEGVDAVNLHASTYLTVGGRVRFEKYGTNRMGCFWIGS